MTSSASLRGGRALQPGPRRRVRLGIAALCVAVLVVAGAATALALGHRSSTPVSSHAKYGGLPSWLPKASLPAPRVLHASATHQVLAIQGETVAVALGGGHVLVTAVGPQVPEEGESPVPATSPCTFVVTFSAASAPIAIDPRAFALIDDLGHVRHPRVRAMNGGPAPTVVAPSQTVSLKLYDVLPTGDGGLVWAPSARRPLVAWDFQVEID